MKIRTIFLWSLAVYFATALFSVGFFSWDEHYQTLEFLSPRLGRGSVADLPWEYARSARPWLQPAIYSLIIRAVRFAGELTGGGWGENAANWVTALRMFHGFLTWLTLGALIRAFQPDCRTPQSKRAAVFLSAFLCFLPFLGVRTSSENFSATVFFLGLAVFFMEFAFRELVAGVLMGAAVQFRYQSALFFLAFLVFLLFGQDRRIRRQELGKEFWKDFAVLVCAFFAMTGVGVLVDSWGYGHWTFVPWNYFRANVLEGRANAFSRDPLFFYFARYAELLPPVGALVFLGVFRGWIKRPGHVLTWVTAPFFLVHCLLGHKEVRFLFPLALAAPLLVSFGCERAFGWEKWNGTAWKYGRWIFLPANFAFLCVLAFKPAYSPFLLYGYIGSHPEIGKIYFRDEDPFVQIRTLKTDFFKPPGMLTEHFGSYAELAPALAREEELWLFEGAAILPPEAEAELSGPLRTSAHAPTETTANRRKPVCTLKFSAFPGWLNALNFIPGIRFANRRSLFFCSFH